MMGRLLIVSNRLPVTVRCDSGRIALSPSSGGLATGLGGQHERGTGLWIGWAGELPRLGRASDQTTTVDEMLAFRRLVPVHLSHHDVRHYYEGFSNGVIWPLFHYLLEHVEADGHDWQAYRDVNEKFADRVAEHFRPGDTIWVHDYHLMLVPGLLRARFPDAPIGFFLHIPFPSSELFRTLPWRESLLEGLLGADLVGFHTHAYLRHFVVALRQVLGLRCETDQVEWRGRTVRLGHFPMGVDHGAFERLAADPATETQAAALRSEAGGRAILLGVDRLDYTKGIPRRLLAFERLLETDPGFRDRARLIQVAVPSRDGVAPYEAFRRQVEEIVGRINGRFGTTAAAPVHYLHRSLSRPELVALYRAADVMLVTPIRDGMNLIAKEFVASRIDDDGVLILSEFAGAASELGEALLVNPYDPDAAAGAMRRALTMDVAERQTRMRELRRRVRRQNLHRWTVTFLGALANARRATGRVAAITTPADVAGLAERLRRAERLVLLLDYDGTLVPFTQVPDLAAPDAELLDMLRTLASLGTRSVHVVSGRARETLSRWFGDLPIDLWAEHGMWHRANDSPEWHREATAEHKWADRARPILEWFTAQTPGSLIETKTNALTWHYRMSDPEMGDEHARHLRRTLVAALHGQPVDIVAGSKVVELRPRAATKGRVVRRILERQADSALILAVGDDSTDEDMFAALPASHISVRVGSGPTRAVHRLPDSQAVRALVRGLLQ